MRLLKSSKWLAVLIGIVIAIVCNLTDAITADRLLEIVSLLVVAGVGGTALEDALAKLRTTYKSPN